MAIGDTVALRRWNSIVKETQPIFDDIEKGEFSNQDLSRLSQVLRKQSKLASTIFEQNIKLVNTQAQSYIPQIKSELAKLGEEVSPKNISKVVDEVFKNLLASNIQQITEKVKDVISTDSTKQFEKAAKDAYSDFLKQYGRQPVEAPKGGDYTRVVDPDSNTGVLEKIYNSIVNLAQAIVDLPSTVADKVKSGIESGVATLTSSQEAPTLQDFSLKQEVLPLPEKLEEKLVKEPPQKILPESDDAQAIVDLPSTDTQPVFQPPEQNSDSQEILDGLGRLKSDFIQSVVRDGNETRERMNAQTGVIVSAINESVSEEPKKVVQKNSNKQDEKTNDKKEQSLVMRIVDRLGYKYVRAIKAGVSAFSSKLHKAFDKVKDFAGTTMNIAKYLMLGGIGLYIAKRLFEKIKWTELIKTALSKIFPGLFGKPNEDPTAPENDPRNTDENGLRSGYGVNEKGEKQYTVQTPDGKFSTIVTKADGSREIRESDYDTRVIQDGPYKGWMVKETGNLSEIDSPFGDEDTGTYTDYINPQTGKVVRHYDSQYGIAVKDKTLVEKDDEAVKQITQGGRVISKVPTSEPKTSKMDLPPDYTPSSKTLVTQQPNTESYSSPSGMLSNSKVVTARPATSYLPKEKESKPFSTPMQPTTSSSSTKGKGQQQPPFALIDMLNLGTTRTNGNRADETLGLLNGRDF